MSNKVKASIILWTYKKDKKGRHPIYIRLTEMGKSKYISTGYSCLPEYWSSDTSTVNKGVHNSMAINADIRHQMNKIQNTLVTTYLEGNTLTMAELATHIKYEITGDDFYKFCDVIKATIKLKNGKADLVNQFDSRVRKIQSFAPHLALSSITQPFLTKYEKFMSDAGNSINTIGTNIKFLRKIMNLAKTHKLLKDDNYPFGKGKHKVTFEQTLRTHVQMEILEPFIKTIDSPGYPENVRTTGWYWVLCCYCGLRYADAALFNFDENIIDGHLILKTDKNGQIVSIPVTDDLAKAIQEVKGKTLMANQTVNSHLKTIAKDAKIKKVLTFHVARHSFAMHCAKLGIPIEVAQVLLGHEDIETTKIYYNILNPTIHAEMKKWNKPKLKTDGELDDEIARLIALKTKKETPAT